MQMASFPTSGGWRNQPNHICLMLDGLYDADQTTAGVSSVIGGLGYTSIMSFVNGAYNISTGRFPSFVGRVSCHSSETGGIIPINNPMIPSIEAWGSTAYGDAYPRVTLIGSNYYHGFSSNQTLSQQGLTANVSCRSQNFSDPTSFPYIALSNSTFNISIPGLDSPFSITSWSWNTTCSDNVFSCKVGFNLRYLA